MNCFMTGRRGEDLAAAFLLEKGYRLLERNWRTRAGEIDIICEDNGVIVFCEVKARRSKRCGTGAESVNHRKQIKLVQIATRYLQKNGKLESRCRFDVLEIDLEMGKEAVRHIENAFENH
jgi:putative endonuclease